MFWKVYGDVVKKVERKERTMLDNVKVRVHDGIEVTGLNEEFNRKRWDGGESLEAN